MQNFETVWEFKTARFRIALEIEPEDMDPADSFQFQDDIDAVRNGEVEWFYARVAVYMDDNRIAWDGLGGCAYKRVSDFYDAHWKYREGTYFTDMVRSAISQARKVLCDVPKLRCLA
jgi:hypothetical protein